MNFECEQCGEITGDVRPYPQGLLCLDCVKPCDMCGKTDCICDDLAQELMDSQLSFI